jgi:hypothetical protein
MALNKFIPTSPDENIRQDSDMATAKFGHLNTIVDALNSGEVGGTKLALQTAATLGTTMQPIINGCGATSNTLISCQFITNRGGGNCLTNVAFGENALRDKVSGGSNVAIGYNTMVSNQSGDGNTAVGRAPLALMCSGSWNTALGYEAMVFGGCTTNNNVVIGNRSMQLSSAPNHAIQSNIAIGGSDTMRNNTGSSNIILGNGGLSSNTTASTNVGMGHSVFASSSSSCQVGIGHSSLRFNTTGYGNTAVGYYSMCSTSTGCGNTAMGSNVMRGNTSGCFNTASGYFAMVNNTTGSNNTVLGACASSGNFSGSVILGREAAATANNQFVVGSSTFNAGTVTTESNSSTKVWNVKINGVDHKILLA